MAQVACADALRMEEIRPFLLDARENYPEPYYLLEYKGVPFSVLGGIQALSGQKKNGKTFVLAQLMAAVLACGSAQGERAEAYLQGLRVPERTRRWLKARRGDGHEPTVLYVDTEMEKLNSAKVLRRVHWLCGWEMNVPNERLHVLWLRGVADRKDEEGKVCRSAHEERKRLIRLAVDVLEPDAVFIDGLRDLCGDFNDNEESAELVGELMEMAERRGMCVWNVLHLNPRQRNDDESKMRGHLGTELGNKATDTLVSVKKKEVDGRVSFTVMQEDTRGQDMEDWRFEVTDAAGALGVPRILGGERVLLTEEQRLVADAEGYLKLFPWQRTGATYTELERFMRSKGVTSTRRLSQLMNAALEAGVIFRDSRRKYFFNRGSGADDDQSGSIPFEPSDGGDVPF